MSSKYIWSRPEAVAHFSRYCAEEFHRVRKRCVTGIIFMIDGIVQAPLLSKGAYDERSDYQRTQQYWLDHLRAAEASDDSIAGYARSNDLKPKDLYMWKGILARRGFLDDAAAVAPKSEFIEVVPTKAQQVAATRFVVPLPNGVRIECQSS
ncbi:MAG: hypothetical protein AAF290_08185 [Pseudomonadota bacterium]